MKKISVVIMLLVTAALLFQGCFGPGTNNNRNYITVNSNIETNTTWQPGKVYVIDGSIGITATLTIQPGTIIKFKPYSGLLVSGGAINATGSGYSHITFTAFADDSIGGDTDANGSAVTPSRGYWQDIFIETTGSTFSYCDFYYGGDTSWATVTARFCDVNIDHCAFAHNSTLAVHIVDGGASTTVTDNTFYDNYLPIKIGTIYDFDGSNVFHNPANITQINDYNGVWAYGDVGATLNWGETEVPYVVDIMTVAPNTTFNIASGAILKFQYPDSGLILGENYDIPQFATVTFTSYKDDAYGGDTNNDGSDTSPAIGDWDGIAYDIVGYPYLEGDNIRWAEAHL